MEIQVLKEWNGKALIDVLVAGFSISKNKAKELLDRKAVMLNKRRVWMAKHTVRTGDLIEVAMGASASSLTKATKEAILILYEDRDLLVLSKPAGILTNGKNSFEEQFQIYFKNKNYRAVHRLDRDTSGALIVSKNKKIFEQFVELFKEQKVEKVYRAIICGVTSKREQFVIETPLEGKAAYTRVSIKKRKADIALAEIEIKTGRTHQIRKHLFSLGMQLLGDREYEIKRSARDDLRLISRQMLHAYSIAYPGLGDGKPLKIVAKYPDDFAFVLKKYL